MINIIIFLFVCLGLVSLYVQNRIYLKQKHLIKIESKALKKLRKKNRSFLFQKPEIIEKVALDKNHENPKFKMTLPQVRTFEFPKHMKRIMERSMIRN